MMREILMRTTLTIDDDVLLAARGLAQHSEKTIGEVISDLARKALVTPDDKMEVRNGIPLIPVKRGTVVTTEMINRLRDEMP